MYERFVSMPNIPKTRVTCAVISYVIPEITDELQRLGIRTVNSQKLDSVEGSESAHADMSLFHVGNERIFASRNISPVLRDELIREGMSLTYTEMPVTAKIPCLNACLVGDKVICNTRLIDKELLKKLSADGKKILHTNQGYTKCSSLQVAENAVITADKSIEKALKNNGAEVLLISPGNIELKGFDYGFIGGAGFYDNGTVYFFGNVKNHPDYDKIRQFCTAYNSEIEILCQDMPLTDIGGAVI